MNWKKTWHNFTNGYDDWESRLKKERGSMFSTARGKLLVVAVVVLAAGGLVLLNHLSRYFSVHNYRHLAAVALENRFYDEARQNYEKLIELGDVQALYDVADLYFEGRGTMKNTVTGLEYLNKAAEAGYSPAMVKLGKLYSARGSDTSTCVGHDYKQAYEWFMKAGDNPDALYAIGQMYKRGLGGLSVDESMANSYFNRWIDIYEKRADKGDVEASRTLARYFGSLEKNPANEERTVYWYEQGAKRNDIASIEALAFAFYLSPKQDVRDKADKYFKRLEKLYQGLIKRGNTRAMVSLSYLYSIKTMSLYDPAKSRDLIIKAAELNNDEAKLILAHMISTGAVSEQEANTNAEALRYEAKRLKEIRAEGGDIDAMRDLAFEALTGTQTVAGNPHGISGESTRYNRREKNEAVNSRKAGELAKRVADIQSEDKMVVLSESGTGIPEAPALAEAPGAGVNGAAAEAAAAAARAGEPAAGGEAAPSDTAAKPEGGDEAAPSDAAAKPADDGEIVLSDTAAKPESGDEVVLSDTAAKPESGDEVVLSDTAAKPEGGDEVVLSDTAAKPEGGDEVVLSDTAAKSAGGDEVVLSDTAAKPEGGTGAGGAEGLADAPSGAEEQFEEFVDPELEIAMGLDGNGEAAEGGAAEAGPDYEEAVKWFTMAAQKGDSKSMYELANIYNDDSPFSNHYDPQKAVYWLKQSAALCYEPAYLSLGEIYNKPGSPVENAGKAQEWLTKAATEGDFVAQKKLAEALARGGKGVQSDMFNALKWTLVLKSYIGTFDTDSWYKDDVNAMEKRYSYYLTPAQVIEAQKEAEVMRMKYGSAW